MEERDIQVRGYTLRLPLDVLLVASANPEDYTNRGRIITPLKDRFGAEVRTHYPLELADEIAVIDQEAELTAPVPAFLLEVLARFTRALRESSAVDQGSGVSARFSVAAAETVAAAALRRSAVAGEQHPTARPIDLEAVPDVLRGKLEFASGEEGREGETLQHLLRRATADTARARLRGLDLQPLAEAVGRTPVRTGERVPAAEVVAALPRTPVLTEVARRLGAAGTEDPGPMAAAAELALEYLFLTRKLAKDTADDETVSYG
jgi:magnesium chelatase subunit I